MDSVGVAHGRFHASVEKKQNRVMEKPFKNLPEERGTHRCVWVVHLTVTF